MKSEPSNPSKPTHSPKHSDLPRDLMALRYLDALNAGDLEAVAALWDEASRDPQLERMLADLDGALFTEEITEEFTAETDQSSLAEPCSRQRQRRTVAVGIVGALAAACLLAVFAWPGRDGNNPLPVPAARSPVNHVRSRSGGDSARVTAWLETRRLLNGVEMTDFTWPLPETSPIGVSRSIPPELLD